MSGLLFSICCCRQKAARNYSSHIFMSSRMMWRVVYLRQFCEATVRKRHKCMPFTVRQPCYDISFKLIQRVDNPFCCLWIPPIHRDISASISDVQLSPHLQTDLGPSFLAYDLLIKLVLMVLLLVGKRLRRDLDRSLRSLLLDASTPPT